VEKCVVQATKRPDLEQRNNYGGEGFCPQIQQKQALRLSSSDLKL
jgi:hypothetical protein